MRKWVDKYLSELADTNNRIKLIIADVGDFPVFSTKHPETFINVGVSESNAVGVAAGLASAGYLVYLYGVSSFFLYRAYEQFKYSIAYWQKNVTFIGVGFGWKYYNIGIGHFCPDDILLVQGLPSFEIHTPYNLNQLYNLLCHSTNYPRYIRLTANIVSDNISTQLKDRPIVIVCYGEMVDICLSVFEYLNRKGYNIGFLPFAFIEKETIKTEIEHCIQTKFIIIEDQCEHGGLYSILKNLNVNVISHMCLPILPNLIAPSRIELLKGYKLDEKSIINRIIEVIKYE